MSLMTPEQEIAMLRKQLNEVLSELAQKDRFVRWFATEYGLENIWPTSRRK